MPSANEVVTGDRKLDRQLKELGDKTAKRINASAIRSGMAVVRKAVKAETPRGPTGNLKRSIGARFKKNRTTGIYEAKVGGNVGKRSKETTTRGGKVRKANAARHAHLVLLGTSERFTKSGASRGTTTANDAVGRGFAKSQARARSVISKRLLDGIKKAQAA